MKTSVLALVCASFASPIAAQVVVMVETGRGGIMHSIDEPGGAERLQAEAQKRGGQWKVLLSTRDCGHWSVWRAGNGVEREYFASSGMPTLQIAEKAASDPAYAWRTQRGRGGVVQSAAGGRYDCKGGGAPTNTGFDVGNWKRPTGGVVAAPGGTPMRPSPGAQPLPGFDPKKHVGSGRLGQTPLGDFPAPINVATILTPGALPGSDGMAAGLPGSGPPTSARAEVCLPDRPGIAASAWRGRCANAKPVAKPPVVVRKAPAPPPPPPPPPKKKKPKPTPTPAPKYASACASLDSLANAYRPIVVVTQPQIYVTASTNTLLYLRNLDTGQTYRLGSSDKGIPPGRYILGVIGVANAASSFTEKIYACLNYRV